MPPRFAIEALKPYAHLDDATAGHAGTTGDPDAGKRASGSPAMWHAIETRLRRSVQVLGEAATSTTPSPPTPGTSSPGRSVGRAS
ncbi:hypothetical protein C5613_41480 [Rhodococcus opacus]|uniref:Uncharacterized protein n=1 Tax=Rhodococcus opacus TaxID=37919 RepID=A0A2S8IGV1_RHOOP|nr:hypothetical protein C5613_41480 [Rhodococcus opacus]